MAKTKKFKTVAGYLRSEGERLQYRGLPKDKDERIAAVRAGQRNIINNLLPQIGVTERIGDTETPREGVDRLLKLNDNKQQVAALQACRSWLKNYITVLSVVPQIKTAEGLISYWVNGFRRDDYKTNVSMIVDADEYHREESPHQIAERIAGPDYCFHTCGNINELIPDSAKNRLFMSDEELCAAAPQLKPRVRRRSA